MVSKFLTVGVCELLKLDGGVTDVLVEMFRVDKLCPLLLVGIALVVVS